jgi:hypothetical protein
LEEGESWTEDEGEEEYSEQEGSEMDEVRNPASA